MEKKYTRKCPECGCDLFYSSYMSWWKCKKNNSKCRKCSSKYKNPFFGKNNKSWKGYEGISLSYFNGVKNNAKKRKLDFDITIKDMWDQFEKQNKKCVYTGLELQLPRKTRSERTGTASLDRINSNGGYIPKNIQWVHKDVNWMKQDFNNDYFIRMCDLVSKNIISSEKISEGVV